MIEKARKSLLYCSAVVDFVEYFLANWLYYVNVWYKYMRNNFLSLMPIGKVDEIYNPLHFQIVLKLTVSFSISNFYSFVNWFGDRKELMIIFLYRKEKQRIAAFIWKMCHMQKFFKVFLKENLQQLKKMSESSSRILFFIHYLIHRIMRDPPYT